MSHTNHLGNVGVLSDKNGSYISGSLTLLRPFGSYRREPNTNPDITDRGYTGHAHNAYIKLIDMNARWYLPEIGRFISPDTIVPEPENPQSFNRYSYTYNNPINFSDPSGHDRCGVAGTTCHDEVPIVPIQGEWPFNEDNPYSSLIGTEFEGANTMTLELVLQWLWNDPNGAELNDALSVLAAIRGLDLDDVQRQYVTYYQLKTQANFFASRNGHGPVLGSDDSSWWGSTEQLRFGIVIGNAFGIDPVFGALLSPTGGRIGGGDSGLLHSILRNDEAISYHGQVHDAGGYLYNYHNSGPGYTYAKPNAPVSQRGQYWMGQASGIDMWNNLIVDESN